MGRTCAITGILGDKPNFDPMDFESFIPEVGTSALVSSSADTLVTPPKTTAPSSNPNEVSTIAASTDPWFKCMHILESFLTDAHVFIYFPISDAKMNLPDSPIMDHSVQTRLVGAEPEDTDEVSHPKRVALQTTANELPYSGDSGLSLSPPPVMNAHVNRKPITRLVNMYTNYPCAAS